MQKFREMMEARGNTAVFTFGRLNPPTIGHGKLIDAMAKQQSKNSGSKMHIFVSHSQDAKKNPLSYNKKVAYIRKMFPKYAKNVLTSKARTIFEVAVALHDKGYKAIVMVVGSDRVAEFEKLLNEYNGVESRHGYYGFDNIEVVSAGERDPDAEGATGMSASKMRAAAVEGDFESFKKGLPSTFKDDKKIYQDIRKEMGIREQRDMGSMDVYEEMRDEYLTGKIWNVGDTIEANGKVGEIVRKGTNYVSYVTEDGKVHKAWLHHIELKERDYRKEYDNYHSKPEQVERRSSRNKARRVMGDKTKKGMDVGHKDNNPLNNSPKNLRNEDPSKNRREPRLREKRDAGYPDDSEKIGKKHYIIYKDRRDWYGFEVDKDGNQLGDAIFDPRKGELKKMILRLREEDETTIDEMAWFMKAKAKIDQMTHPKSYEAMVKRFISAMKTPSNNKKTPSSIAAEIAREYSVSSRGLIQYINKLVDKGVLPKELKAEYQVESFSDFVSKINEVKQDSDIKDRKGTQPAKYYAKDAEGDEMSPATKKKRDSHFKAKKSGPAPGDSGAETRPSKHTQKFKRMYGEKLGKDADQGDYIDDFQKSDAPQFKGKSKEKRKDMAIAAYLSKNESLLDNVNKLLSESGHTDVASMKNKVTIALKALQKMDSELSKLGDEDDLPTWWTNKVATAVSRIDDMADYLDSQVDESLWANIHKKRKEGRPMRKKGEKGAPTAAQMKRAKGEEIEEDIELNEWGEIEEESEYQGRKVTLNKPMAGDVKKSKVYVKNEKGTVVKVNFGDKNMTIKKNIPARRKSFRARHNCDNPGPKWKARYWSCKAW